MDPLQVEKGEQEPSSTDVSAIHHLRSNNVESTRDGGEEGEGKEHSGLHDGREEGTMVSEREHPRVFM